VSLVRARAARSRLLGEDELARLRAGPRASVLAELHLGDDALAAWRILWERLVADYATMLRSLPDGRELVQALLGLHEIENVKLVGRAVRNGVPPERWAPWWRPLGRAASISFADWNTVGSAAALVERAARGPYAEAARLAAGEKDGGEVLIDRWASRRVVLAARALPARDREARDLALARVRERDLDVLARADAWGFTPEQAARACALLPDELGTAAVQTLRAPAERGRALRAERLARCRRTFLGPPLALTPAIALLMIEEATLDDVTSLLEAAPC
jgi:hypothetical protein